MPHPFELHIYCTNLIIYLNSEFQLSRPNGFRVIEKGHSSTFEVCHDLLSPRSTVQIWLNTILCLLDTFILYHSLPNSYELFQPFFTYDLSFCAFWTLLFCTILCLLDTFFLYHSVPNSNKLF